MADAEQQLSDHGEPSRATWAVVRSPEDLGKFVSRRRVQTGWTQRELAAHLGFPYRYLHEIESGKQTLAYTRLFALLRLLGIELRLEAASSGDGTSADGDDTESGQFSDPSRTASRESKDFFADFDDLDDDYLGGDDR
ncbi:helix-turn-helix domain-containing protein [Nocardioides pelophilus]|uniref:helix-turn-helix domain-containing protein n=1 Tax=Nocardioides pelophilus TaxID=2172019 RepID=UPI00160446FD|nr:helix-turn-helix domain-containing protein [Nocardioides pelophilus]